MSRKPKAPARRAKASPASRLRPFWILFALVACVAVAVGYYLATLPALRPRTVEIVGNNNVSRSEILAAAAVDPVRNMWLQNTHAIAARIESIADIGTATVYRKPPATMIIDVSERVPFAVVAAHDTTVVVDHDLRVLREDDAPPAHLPTFVLGVPADNLAPGTFLKNPELRQLRNDDDALLAAHIAPMKLQDDRYGQLIATLDDGVRLLLGDDDDLAKKIPLIRPILAQVTRSGRPIAALDLRAPTTPIVVYQK